MSATKIVTDATFADDVLLSDRPVIVDFWAEWCGPCRMVAPILEELAGEHDEVVVAKLNVDENPSIAAQYGITSIPTMNVYQKVNPGDSLAHCDFIFVSPDVKARIRDVTVDVDTQVSDHQPVVLTLA